ncbi:MAG TPA: MlaD family protein [Pseudonocardia sp.]|jgi:phospholipid/cholesterol/gamma-HCH transport system substrate-binding protein|nr:MlaD family protein [Pseudonocardia sp.]
MITRATIVRAVLFVVLTVGLVLYIGAHFLGLFSFVGAQDYNVRVPLQNANGLFERSEVTYRGVKAGIIDKIELTDTGVSAVLKLDGGGTPIPADLTALVADRSAVGERYIDLRPNRDGAPYLKDGDLVPADRVKSPVPVEDVLANLDKLASTVPLPDLQTTVSELGQAFGNLGPKLQLLLDSTNALVTTANQTLPQTVTLIHDARTVLNTQNDLADPIKSFSSDLKKVTQQLKDSDPDVRRLLKTGPDAGRELSTLIDQSGDDLGHTVRELDTTSKITRGHLRDIQSVLQLYPGLAAAVPTILPTDGSDRARLGLVINFNDPPLCTKGYEATIDEDPKSVARLPINYRAYCREPIFSPTDVRGIKPQYPFVNDRPQQPPDWFFSFYTDGPQAGIKGSPADYQGGRRKDTRPHNGWSDSSVNYASLPGLLSAPATYGQFGLLPTLLGSG